VWQNQYADGDGNLSGREQASGVGFCQKAERFARSSTEPIKEIFQ
jgi:hypothetical protein